MFYFKPHPGNLPTQGHAITEDLVMLSIGFWTMPRSILRCVLLSFHFYGPSSQLAKTGSRYNGSFFQVEYMVFEHAELDFEVHFV